ncbi:MAG: PilZ domain-containing protein [Kofleriaceae bacterium]|nr:PilZ domain-containing protein [Kofleriaceae bacterium]
MLERRFGFRIPLTVFGTSYVRDRPVRVLCSDVSDSGVGMTAVHGVAPPAGTVVGVELELPGTTDTLWAAGEICRHHNDGADGLTTDLGLRFTAMARLHARLLRDFCVEARRGTLTQLLSRVRLAS